MSKSIGRGILATIVFSLVFLLSPVNVAVVSAGGGGGSSASRDAACEGVRLTGGSCDTDPSDPNSADNQVSGIIKTVINLFSLVVGVAAVIMIMVGGLKYITSMGDPNNVNSAKNTILYAVVGLVIVALAQVIVRFVLGRL